MFTLKTLFPIGSVVAITVLLASGLYTPTADAVDAANPDQSEETIAPVDDLLNLSGPYLGQRSPRLDRRVVCPGHSFCNWAIRICTQLRAKR